MQIRGSIEERDEKILTRKALFLLYIIWLLPSITVQSWVVLQTSTFSYTFICTMCVCA